MSYVSPDALHGVTKSNVKWFWRDKGMDRLQ